jgi:spore coat protein SA
MKLALIVPSMLPVPSVKGGAIETLVTGLIDQNEEKRQLDITVFSTYNKDAVLESRKYVYTRFIWTRYTLFNKIINVITRCYSKISKKSIPHFGILQIIYHLKRFQFDLVVLEGNEKMIIPLCKALGKTKILFHLHSATLFSKPDVFNYCKTIIVVSNYLKTQVTLKTARDDVDVVILKNCIDLSKFKKVDNIRFKEEIRLKYGILNNEITLCYVGRIDEGKGVKELIEALLLIPKDINYKIFIVGSAGLSFGLSSHKTEYYTEVLELAKNLNDKVIFTGFIHNNLIPKILASSDISIIPSICEEAQGLVVLENLAASVPIVVTDSGGIVENVTEECAIIVKRDENFIPNLSSAIQELLISKEKREAMGKAGFIHVQKYNYDNYYSDFIRILNL